MPEPISSSLTAPVAQSELNGFLGLIEALGIARCAQLIADFCIADALDDAPATAAEVAARAGVNADALGRVMRYAVTFGVFEEAGEGRFRHTVRSRLLRSDHPQSLQGYTRLLGPSWPVFGALDHSLRTGRSAVEALAPGGVWEWLSANPHFAKVFDLAMASKARGDLATVLAAYDFSRFRSFADIGGGQGHLLRAVLDNVPDATGTLFDQPAVVDPMRDRLGNRMSGVGGDFFKDTLPRADAYLLMHVIHDWDDEHAVAILRKMRSAAPTRAKLLLIEVLLPQTSQPVREASRPAWPAFLHFSMLAWSSGQERTSGEYERLLDASGWRLERVVPTESFMSILEAAPV
ncbi:MAG: methyltransferase [Steroidobacteraceae bacterium]